MADIATGLETPAQRKAAFAQAYLEAEDGGGSDSAGGDEEAGRTSLDHEEAAVRARMSLRRGEEEEPPSNEEPTTEDASVADEQPQEPARGSREWMLARAKAAAAEREAKANASGQDDYRRRYEEAQRAREEAERRALTPREDVLASFRRDPVEFLRSSGLDPAEALKTLQSAALNPEGRRAESAAVEAERKAAKALERAEALERRLEEERQQAAAERRQQAQISAFHRLVDDSKSSLPLLSGMPEGRRLGVVRAVLAEMADVGFDSPSDEDVAYAAEEFLRSVAGTRGAGAPVGHPPKSAGSAPQSGRKTITGADASQRPATTPFRGVETAAERRVALARAVRNLE